MMGPDQAASLSRKADLQMAATAGTRRAVLWRRPAVTFLMLLAIGSVQVSAQGLTAPIGQSFTAQDSLAEPDDASADAQQCLEGLCWKSATFTVQCLEPAAEDVTATIRFPSPRPLGNATNDLVAMEWYAAVDGRGELRKAPAVVVVHESGSSMPVGRMIARGLRERGLHAMMLQLPFYGLRRPQGEKPQRQNFASLISQGIADARRAHDAVAVLPGVQSDRIGLLGVSLGGFVSATTAGLDRAYDPAVVMLAGGDLPTLIEHGERETAEVREMLARQGITGEALHELLNRIEPNRLAHRIGPQRLWLYSATRDTVVPPSHAESFAQAAGLEEGHHIRMLATHYSGIIYLPAILDRVAAVVKGEGEME